MEAKKISFGFSKINKKVNLLPAGSSSAIGGNAKQRNDGEKIELISCLEGQSIKIVGKENGDDEPPALVIPLRQQDKTTIPDRLAKLQEIIEGKDTEESSSKKDVEAPEGPIEGETIEQRAAREIMEDLKERKSRSNEKNTMVVPLKPEDLPLDGGRESTMDDYESVPIEKFGLAMLRGMGWKEDPNAPKKDNKLPEGPVQRPKGMGLGAERVPKDKNRQLIPPAKDEVLTMKKGAFVKVLAGKHKESYGAVESLDEENARVVVRFSISGNKESLNEYLLQLVSNAEYKKYSKVLNNAKYEEFKNRTTSTTVAIKEEKLDDRRPIKRETSNSPPAARPTSSSKAQSSRSNRDHGQQRDRRDRTPDRHTRRDREDRPEDEHRHYRPRERRSRSREDRRRHDRHRDATSSSDDDSDSNESEDRGRHQQQQQHRHKTSSSSSYGRTSSGTKKKSHKYKQRRDHSRERVHSSDEDDRHHKKKTKKSKKQRSRSRSRR